MPQKFNNNAASTTSGGITSVATTINVASGDGVLFPTTGGGGYFLATLIGLDGNGAEDSWEIVKVTTRVGDVFTVVRAQEDTVGFAWPGGTRIQNRFTASTVLASDNDLSDVASAVIARSNLGLVIGTDVQAHSSVLDATTASFLTADETKLDGIATGANNYSHPANHSPSIISQDAANRFVTDTEKTTWNAKADTAADVGLGNVDNTSDVNKPVSTAQQTALDLKINITEIGVSVQAYSSVLQNTTASFVTADETKLDHISVTQAVDLDAIETRVNALDQAVILMGTFSASGGVFPGGGTAQAGETWIATTAGVINGMDINTNDRVIAIVDNASISVAADWHLADYTDEVLSVAGKTGAVTLIKADVGLGNVNNTSDANKPVSSATQTALNGKIDDAQVLTNVPAGAVFTDTTYTDANIKTKYEANADTNAYTDDEKTKLSGIALSANNYSHPADGVDPGAALTGAYVFSDITVNTAGHVTGSATRQLTLANLGYTGETNATADQTNAEIRIAVEAATDSNVFDDADHTKLNSVANDANNYSHPANHPPSIITQDSDNRFVTDAEKTSWDAKAETEELETLIYWSSTV